MLLEPDPVAPDPDPPPLLVPKLLPVLPKLPPVPVVPVEPVEPVPVLVPAPVPLSGVPVPQPLFEFSAMVFPPSSSALLA
jgi:hypothetical protein